MKVGPHVMTHGHSGQHHRHHHDDREVVPRVGSAQAGGNLKLIQCQLMLLLHARRCQQRHELIQARNGGQPNGGGNGGEGGDSREGSRGGGAGQVGVTNSVARALLLNCPIRHCRAMKEVLNHMKTCRLGGTCTYQHCTTSLRILSHWTNCTIEDCPLCMLVRMRMTRAKEWEATLPRSSRYTLLAAALRSSQAPRPIPPNCQVAEQAQEGQSGVPCLEELDDLRQQQQQQQQHNWPQVSPRENDNQEEDGAVAYDKKQDKMIITPEKCEKCCISATPGPSLDQVRKAYEQLGIPCPEEALKRLMATLPPTSSSRSKSSSSATGGDDGEDLSADENSMDISSDNDTDTRSSSNGDQGIFDCYCSCSSSSSTVPPPQIPVEQQHPIISSTTNSSVPLRLPFNSSR